MKTLQGNDTSGWCGPAPGVLRRNAAAPDLPVRRVGNRFRRALFQPHRRRQLWPPSRFGFLMPLVIFTALACSNLFSLILGQRFLPPPSDRDEPRP